ncbi:MAG: hypothetical protein AAGG01_10950 [Planctomycetota bacterium]
MNSKVLLSCVGLACALLIAAALVGSQSAAEGPVDAHRASTSTAKVSKVDTLRRTSERTSLETSSGPSEPGETEDESEAEVALAPVTPWRDRAPSADPWLEIKWPEEGTELISTRKEQWIEAALPRFKDLGVGDLLAAKRKLRREYKQLRSTALTELQRAGDYDLIDGRGVVDRLRIDDLPDHYRDSIWTQTTNVQKLRFVYMLDYEEYPEAYHALWEAEAAMLMLDNARQNDDEARRKEWQARFDAIR